MLASRQRAQELHRLLFVRRLADDEIVEHDRRIGREHRLLRQSALRDLLQRERGLGAGDAQSVDARRLIRQRVSSTSTPRRRSSRSSSDSKLTPICFSSSRRRGLREAR